MTEETTEPVAAAPARHTGFHETGHKVKCSACNGEHEAELLATDNADAHYDLADCPVCGLVYRPKGQD